MKKALLVGINKYAMPGNDLAGCVNDVTNVRDLLLKYFGFEVANIRVLTDERAIKRNIIDRLTWLVSSVVAGDHLVFHYSGHGSQIRDRNGDELNDGMDEIICPHDMSWDGNFISDDDLGATFAKLPIGVTLDVILDSCHSGTGTRTFSISPIPIRSRFMVPPVDIRCRNEEGLPVRGLFSYLSAFLSGVFGSQVDSTEEADRPIAKMNHALFAGCKDNQTCADAEIGGSANGAFSYYFCKHIRAANGVIARAQLKDRVRSSLRHDGFDQVPQLESPASMFNGQLFQ